nr:MAG TPA: syndecan-2 protein [Caudoviricetes sp.]DAJ90135.1 MAG TPA: syndecan-2 protein [Caudoviricetes sp.]DAP29250.1 MAG TPA: syndecan-2 protein [Bacteriophage sp.]DAP81098.1 MAG TPA: syndecan-2 protein [Caudoviricetes sp.]DAS47843.1 MAG TPA: syndecan-2 protein [Caudoviricetes sp.]
MGAIIGFAVIGIPCAAFLIYCLTPSGKQWLRSNHMI